MFYCGIDIAKYKHEATVIDQTGVSLLDSISFSNSKEGCEKLLALFQRLNIAKEDLLLAIVADDPVRTVLLQYLGQLQR